MNKFLLLIFLAGSLYSAAFAQANEVSPCPKIEVTGPSASVNPGEKTIFAVNVSGVDTNKIEYRWSISDGTIVSGQGSPVIYVSTDGLNGRRIIAEVEIKGLPEKCFNRGNEVADISYGCDLPPMIDEYGKLTWDEEKLRLISAAKQIKASPDRRLMIVVFFPKYLSSAQKNDRISNIEKYLISEHKLSQENIHIMEGSEGVFNTRIYLILDKSRF